MKIYIATGLERAAEQQALKTEIEKLGHTLSYDWGGHGSVQNEGPERIAEVAGLEASGVRSADLFVALLPGGRGTHTELGMAIAFSMAEGSRSRETRRIAIVGELKDASGRECAFYRHPHVTHRFTSAAEFVAWLAGLGEGMGSRTGAA